MFKGLNSTSSNEEELAFNTTKGRNPKEKMNKIGTLETRT